MSTAKWIVLLSGTIGGLAAAYLTGLPLFLGFSIGFIMLIGMAAKEGYSLRSQAIFMKDGVSRTKEVVWILLLVGLLIPAWTASGTIPYLIDAGISALSPGYFLTGTFLFATVISMLLGTSTGTLSAVGIPLIGVGSALHIPEAYIAGAIISGAFVGDRTSPFSSAFRLTAASTDCSTKAAGRVLLPTTAAGIMTAGLLYLGMDLFGRWGSDTVIIPVTGYELEFGYHPVLALPPFVLIVSILLRMKTKYAFLLSIFCAIGIGSIIQGTDTQSWLLYLWGGFTDTALPKLHGKGLSSMLSLVILIAMAGAFNGILEHGRLAERYWSRIVGAAGSMAGATCRTALFAAGLCLVSCTQTLPIMMTGRNLLAAWSARFPARHLTRIVGDTSVLFAVIVPWNMLAVLCAAILGTPVEHFVPFAFFIWTVPVWTILFSVQYDRKLGSMFG